MASITVRATNGTAEQRELARDVVRWFATQGFPIRRNIHVSVHFSDYMDEHDTGSARWKGRNAYQATRFSIMINSNIKQRKALVTTLCHEMVHVRQMAHRRLVDKLETRFGKKEYRSFWTGQDKTNTSYRKQPWEKEAFAMEAQLADRYYAYAGLDR